MQKSTYKNPRIGKKSDKTLKETLKRKLKKFKKTKLEQYTYFQSSNLIFYYF